MIPEWLNPFFTPRVLTLLREAQELAPDAPIEFGTLTDPYWLEHTGGAATHHYDQGRALIEVDPARASEQILAHEIHHVIYYRSGWPWAVASPEDKPIWHLAYELNHLFIHWVICPWMIALGFDPEVEVPINGIEELPEGDPDGIALDHLSLMLALRLLLRADLSRQIKDGIAKKRPRAWKLAKHLRRILESRHLVTPKANIEAMIEVIEFLDDWCLKEFGSRQHLRERLAIEARELPQGGTK